MKQKINKSLLLLTIMAIISCSKNDEAPTIEGVWKNMTAEPIEQTEYAYPGQTLCIHGSGFSELRRLFVNGTDIDLSSTLIYDTDSYITFQLPADVRTSTYDQQDYIRVITAYGEAVYRPFLVKPASEQPSITHFSSTTLVAGRTLTITGVNLGGVTDVWLPLAFGDKVRCELSAESEPTPTNVSVIIPDGVSFATGKCVIAMQKTDFLSGRTYTERVYSSTTDFTN